MKNTEPTSPITEPLTPRFRRKGVNSPQNTLSNSDIRNDVEANAKPNHLNRIKQTMSTAFLS